MREIRPSSLEGGVRLIPHPYPYRKNVRCAGDGPSVPEDLPGAGCLREFGDRGTAGPCQNGTHVSGDEHDPAGPQRIFAILAAAS